MKEDDNLFSFLEEKETTDIMYDEHPKYKKGEWQELCNGWEHSDVAIKGMFGDYRFLSNFYQGDKNNKIKIIIDGIEYDNSETAYQAMKVIPEVRKEFSSLPPYLSKKEWKKYPAKYSAKDWDDNKYNIMFVILFDKFTRNDFLRQKLKETRNKYIEETNWWGDKYWGVCNSVGKNNLGKILMDIRRII